MKNYNTVKNAEKDLKNEGCGLAWSSCKKLALIIIGVIGIIIICMVLFYNVTAAFSKNSQEKTQDIKAVSVQQNVAQVKDNYFEDYIGQFDQLFQEMDRLRNRILWQNGDYIFDNAFAIKNRMNTNITTYDKQYVLNIEAPGFDKEQLKIEIQGDYLIVSGKKAGENKEDEEYFYLSQASRDSFQHKLLLSKEVDKNAITSNLKNGVLTIVLPRIPLKKEASKEIPIN